MILIGIGSNLGRCESETPLMVAGAALEALEARQVRVLAHSSWYETEPVPASDQPWFINGVVQVASDLAPRELLALLHEIETAFGRRRTTPNAARVLDLDLLDHDGRVVDPAEPDNAGLVLPHPRICERLFVLAPLAELVSDWRHPVSGSDVGGLVEALPPGQQVRRIAARIPGCDRP